MTQTTIINLYGGPGCGKSTLAADVFATLKKGGASVELVREYVKDWAWRGAAVGRWDQPYLIAKQLRAESALYGKVEFIVTDSPILLATVFEARYQPNSYIGRELAWQIRTEQEASGAIHNVDLMARRQHPYEAAGRYEAEAAALEIDAACAALFGGKAPVVGSVEEVIAAVREALPRAPWFRARVAA
jgi:RecA/RadA recombinase